MKLAFLYAGQGSQKVGMGKDFYETYPLYREFIDSLELDYDFKKLMHEGPIEELSLTEYTQGCMAAFAAGVTKLLFAAGIRPEAVCGLSLGEYGALHCAGVFDAQEYVKLTAFRGSVMAKAAEGIDCAMSAIIGLPGEKIAELCTGSVTIANYNYPGQSVICGEASEVSEVEAKLKEAGARRCVRVNVSGPFHTKYMEPAGVALEQYLSKLELKEPEIPVAMNATGDFYESGQGIIQLLKKQVQSSVRFENDLRTLLEAGYDTFVEIGPGTTLTGFLKKTTQAMGIEVTHYSVETVEGFEAVKEKLCC